MHKASITVGIRPHPLVRALRASLSVGTLAIATQAQATTYTVNTAGDPSAGTGTNCASGNPGTCSLRDAIAAAAAGGDSIVFDPSVTHIVLGNELVLNAATITIDGGSTVTLDGNPNSPYSRVFNIPGGSASITGMTIRNGHATWGGGIFIGWFGTYGTLTLTNSTITGNTADKGGGGIYTFSGSTLAIIGSTVFGNSAVYFGGGIGNSGATFTLTNSTVSGNYVRYSEGCGIENRSSTVTLNHATVFGNGGLLPYAQDLYDYHGTGTVTVSNSIIGSCGSWSPTDGGGNVEPYGSCHFGAGPNAYLNLGPLRDNGGSTQTMLPGKGSAAIDAIAPAACGAATDQRGVPRPQGAGCDAGAVEVDTLFSDGFEPP